MAFRAGQQKLLGKGRRRSKPVSVAVRRQAQTNTTRSRTATRKNVVTAGFLGIEKKFYDTTLVDAAILAPSDAAGGEHDPSATSMISTPTQGDGEMQRDGKRITITSCQVKGWVERSALLNQGAMPNAERIMVALVVDTQTNGAQLDSEAVFKNLSGDADLACSPMRNLLFGPRFRVLRTEMITFNNHNGAYDGTDIEVAGNGQAFEWFVPFKGEGFKVNFNAGTGATVANVIDNSLHIIAYASVTGVTLSYNARVRFIG